MDKPKLVVGDKLDFCVDCFKLTTEDIHGMVAKFMESLEIPKELTICLQNSEISPKGWEKNQ